MLKNILNKSDSSTKAKASVLADLRLVLKTGLRVGFQDQGQLVCEIEREIIRKLKAFD